VSFTYLGTAWTPHTAAEHAADVLQTINDTLRSRGVMDSDGNLIQMTAVMSNAVWILCLAVGAIRASDDEALLEATKQFSVAEASDAQIQAMLPIAGTVLIPGAYSLLTVSVTAGALGDAVIPTGAKVVFGSVCNFLVLTGATVPSGTTVDFLCQADVIGPIEVAPSTVSAFQTSIANVTVVTNSSAAIPGRYAETVAQVRQRLLSGNIADIGLDGTINAVLAIQGITDAMIFFNYDTVTNLVLQGGKTILPRQAYIVVLGSDETGEAIATAYATRMNSPTSGALSQTYTTLSGQAIAISYDVAASQRVYVRVYYDPDTVLATGFSSEIAALVAAGVWRIGKPVTSVQIAQLLEGFQNALATGCHVSLDDAVWDNEVLIDAEKYGSIAIADVHVLEEP
jgi:hypothetical protein